MKTDSYRLCCLKPVSVSTENCFPQPDDFSSCTDLMKNDVLRGFLWIIAISSLVGNVGVLSYRLFVDRKSVKKSNGFYVMNLGLSDMIMGVYLCTIAITDISLRGNYIVNDEAWRQSGTCKVAGVLAFISCEASVTFILLITIDCFLMVKFPFGTRKITPRLARISSLACWVIIISLSIIPFFDIDYFSEDYYSQTAVCLVLPFSRYKVSGWEYSAAVFVFYNCVAFLITACCQISIYNISKIGSRIKVKETKKDLDLTRRLFLMVFTNFICWFPVGIMGIMALTGEVFPSETYSWVAVFVIPVNAAINPFIYTFSSILKKQKPRILSSMKMLQISKIKRRKTDTPYVLCLASTFVKCKKNVEMDHVTLKELFRSRKLRPKKSYLLLKQLTESVVYLHKHSFTLRQPIS